MMVPFPGTELADNAPKYEIQIKKKDWEKYNKLSLMGTYSNGNATAGERFWGKAKSPGATILVANINPARR